MSESPQKHLLLISGPRQVGKDTLLKWLYGIDSRITRFSFADRLKEDLSGLLMEQFNIDPFDCTAEQKELTRDILIAYGCTWRAIDSDHWVDHVIHRIRRQEKVDEFFIPAVSDGRFPNEIVRLRQEYGAGLHHIDITRVGAPPPTSEEEKHYRQVAAMADYHLNWGHNDMPAQIEHAKTVYNWLISHGLPANQ
jgi:hypothetical protein